MNIKTEKINDTNAQISISIAKNDYQPLVKKSLDNFHKSVTVAGFRKGNVPKSVIQSIYGKNILVDELNKLVLNKLLEYLKKNNIRTLGEPLLIKNNLELNNQEDYKFLFEVGLQPKVNINIGLLKDDKLSYYTIVITDKMIEKQIDIFKTQYAKHSTNADEIEDNDIVKGKLTELNIDNTFKKDGINLNDIILMPFYIKDEVEKAKFIGEKIGNVIIFNPYKAFEGYEVELSHLLKIKKSETANHQGNFSFIITKISRYKQVKTNQELFDKLYGVGIITSEEKFKEKIKEDLVLQFQAKSDYRFLLDIKQLLLEKIKEVRFPEDFLKQWLIKTSPKIKKETIVKKFPNFLQDVKVQFIWNKIIEDNNIKITLKNIQQTAKALVRAQFALYNSNVIADSILESYTNKMLKTEKGIQQLHSRALEIEIVNVLKGEVSLKSIIVTEEEFRKFA